MTVDKISIGDITIHGLRDGFFYLDGGAMFGVVPKVIWEKIYTPDEKNRIQMGLNSLLVQTKQALILIETGIGPDIDQKISDFYSVERKPGLLAGIKKIGFEPEDIDFVINTHLHFDHCGGNTHQNGQGKWIPTFANARYIIQKGEWDYAMNPSYRDKPSYLLKNFYPLKEQECVQLVEGNTLITEGVQVFSAPGHTAHHQCVKISSNEKVLFFLGDMVPMSAHAGLSYIMSYDLFPLQTLSNKKKYFEQAIAEDWIVAFVHEPEFYYGRIALKKNKYFVQPHFTV
jgi:glyoxylase-like metal-dependent hydrolase (beta-lactamase superfamily II)